LKARCAKTEYVARRARGDDQVGRSTSCDCSFATSKAIAKITAPKRTFRCRRSSVFMMTRCKACSTLSWRSVFWQAPPAYAVPSPPNQRGGPVVARERHNIQNTFQGAIGSFTHRGPVVRVAARRIRHHPLARNPFMSDWRESSNAPCLSITWLSGPPDARPCRTTLYLRRFIRSHPSVSQQAGRS
jgi:hypothetical protein